jgi:hypothetical protein
VSAVLALTAVGLVAAAVASARTLESQPRGLLPTGTTGVIVLDLSLSIGEESYVVVRAALQRVVEANERIGLVVFSDVPYELLPPGTPGRELRPIVQLLAPRGGKVRHPWQQGFRAGTRISSGLELARAMLHRDGISPGSILLLSDLDSAPDDFDPLARTLHTLVREQIGVRVVALAPSSEGLALFQGVLGKKAFADPGDPVPAKAGIVADLAGETPLWLLVLGGLCLVALALHERWAARLGLPAPARGRAAQ